MTGLALAEVELLATVRDVCRALRLSCYHTHNSRRSEPGFPDLVIAGPGGILFRELKTATGHITPEQDRWLALLAVSGDAGVWRPADLYNGTIGRQLQALTRPEGPHPCPATPTGAAAPASPAAPDSPS